MGRHAIASLLSLRESLFSSGTDVFVRRVPALAPFLAFDRRNGADKSINCNKRAVWPARCNTFKRNTETKLFEWQC
jgi:hypothetical protein